MDWVFELVSEGARGGSLALLAWGAALCLEETFTRSDRKAEPAGPAAGGAMPAHADQH